MKSLSHVRLFATPWFVAYQAPLSMGFSRQECWNGLPFPSPGDLPDPGLEPRSHTLQADSLLSESPGKPNSRKLELKKKSLRDQTQCLLRFLKNVIYPKLVLCDNLEGWDGERDERRVHEGWDACIPMADSC